MADDTKDQEASEAETIQAEPDARPDGEGSLPTVKAVPTTGPNLSPGEVLLGRYEVVGSLGRGAMGVVLRCLDRVSAVDMAVKALPPELSHNADEMADIKANFQLIHRLHHPHIAGINVLDQDRANGYYFLIMEYVEGVSLHEYRKAQGGTLSLEETAQIVRQVAGALDYAHSKKVIHRDIKPANIMIQPDGTAKVLDFGIAAQLHTSMTRVSRNRYSSSGTAPYMAPEQWEGQFQDESTDQYALAVTAYEMLAGRRPFASHDLKVMMAAVLYTKPERIDALPRRAWSALKKGLAKDRRHRFATCSDLAAALAGSAAPVSHGTPGWKRIAAVLMIISLLCFGTVLHRLHKSKVDAERQRAEAAEELDTLRRMRLARKHMALGDIYREAHQLADARKSYQLAAQADPSFPGLAERLRETRDANAARQLDREKTDDEKELLKWQANMTVTEAEELRKAGKLEEAEATYMEALRLLPGNSDIAKSVQAVRNEIEAREKAKEEERKRIVARQEAAARLASEAAALHKAGSLSEALAKYEQAIKKDPSRLQFRKGMQAVLKDIESTEKEAQALKRRIKALLAEIARLKEQNKLSEVLAKLRELQLLDPDRPGLANEINDVETIMQGQVVARKRIEEERRVMLRVGTLVAAAKALRRDKDLTGALAKYQEAQKLTPHSPDLKSAIESLNKEIEEKAAVRKQTELRKQVGAMITEVRSYIQEGEYAKAIDKCDAALRLNPVKSQADSLAILRRDAVREASARKQKPPRRPRAH